MKPTFTIAIYARHPGPYLAVVARNIRSNATAAQAPFVLVYDGNPMSDQLKQDLASLHVEAYELPGNNSQIEKIKKIISLCQTDVVLLTQDDLIYKPDGIGRLLERFDDPEVTMVSAKIVPQVTGTFFESVLGVGTIVARFIAEHWTQPNYLLANRIMAFRVSTFRKFRIPKKIVSMDAYFYLENKLRGGKFVYCADVEVYTKLAKSFSEYRKQSTRFLHSPDEMKEYFDKDFVDSEYHLPMKYYVQGILYAFLKRPIYFIFYILLQIYVRNIKDEAVSPVWEVDVAEKLNPK